MVDNEKSWVFIAEDDGDTLRALEIIGARKFGKKTDIVGVRTVKEGIEAINRRTNLPKLVVLDVFCNGEPGGEVNNYNSYLPLGEMLITRGLRKITIFGASFDACKKMRDKLMEFGGDKEIEIIVEIKPGRLSIESLFNENLQ